MSNKAEILATMRTRDYDRILAKEMCKAEFVEVYLKLIKTTKDRKEIAQSIARVMKKVRTRKWED